MSSCSLEKLNKELDQFLRTIDTKSSIKKNYPPTWTDYKLEKLVSKFLKGENTEMLVEMLATSVIKTFQRISTFKEFYKRCNQGIIDKKYSVIDFYFCMKRSLFDNLMKEKRLIETFTKLFIELARPMLLIIKK